MIPGGDHHPTVVPRVAQPDDLGAIETLLVAADLPVDGVAAGIGDFFVSEDGGAVVAAVGLEWYGPDALLRSLVVADEFRGRGLGRRLVAECLARAAVEKAEGVYLLTTTAEEFFARLGFCAVAREGVAVAIQSSAEFTSLCPASATVMYRRADA
jgi:amino-acid N-acetyltransferase